MTRTRAGVLGAVAACVAIVVVALSSGGDDGPRSFKADDSTGALLVEWTRVGDHVSGSLTLLAPTSVPFGDDALLREKPREVQQGSSPLRGRSAATASARSSPAARSAPSSTASSKATC